VGRVLQPSRAVAGWRTRPTYYIIVSISRSTSHTRGDDALTRSHPLEAFEKMTRGSLRYGRAGVTSKW